MATKLKKKQNKKKNKKTLKRYKIKTTKGSGSVHIDKPHTTLISGMCQFNQNLYLHTIYNTHNVPAVSSDMIV